MSYQLDRQVISELADTLKLYGYRVFIAESGTYGFYTDQEGSRVVSFQHNLMSLKFSGNYISRKCGTGWRIAENVGIPSETQARNYFNENPPYWATNGERVLLTTLQDILDAYQRSSKFKEV